MQKTANTPTAISRRSLLKGMGFGAGALFLGGTLGACARLGGDGADDLIPVTHQLGWLKITQFAGFMLADANGYYAEEGIDATISSGGPNVIASQQVAAGQALVGDDDNTTVLQAMSEGQPLVIYGTIFQRSPFSVMSLGDNPIRTIEDFEGTTIALSEATRPQLDPLLIDAGVDLDSIEFVPAGPDPAQLATGQVDGYFGFATAQGVSLQRDGLDVVVTPLDDLGFPSYANVLITNPENLEDEFDTLVGFLRGSIRGYDLALRDPDEAGRLVAEDEGPDDLDVETEQAVAAAQIDFIENPGGRLMEITRERMEAVISSAFEAGAIDEELNVDDVMTTEVLEAAHDGLDL